MNVYEKINEEKKKKLAEQVYIKSGIELHKKIDDILIKFRAGEDIAQDMECLLQEEIDVYKIFLELFDYKEIKKEENKTATNNSYRSNGLALIIIAKYKEFKSVRAVKDYLDSTGRPVQDKQIRRVLENAGLYTTTKRNRQEGK